jgi:SPP1 gp7 family putative phage head morphogenesis protein
MPDTPRLPPLPFAEAIAWARDRQVVLPEVYYGELQGLVRANAFTITGLAGLDQIQAVKDSLTTALETGGTFRDWQQAQLATPTGLELGPGRLETIFRNNIQQSYNRGRYEQQMGVTDSHPWWMYDAVNDSRTRPSHAAMDGHVARHDDPIWNQWTPSCGHRCRCRRIALTARQAAKYQAADAQRQADPTQAKAREAALIQGPDPGWGHDPYRDPQRGLREAIAQRRAACQGEPRLALSSDRALWCQHPPLAAALDEMQHTLDQGRDPARLLREVLSPTTYERLAEEARVATAAAGLSEPQGVMLRAYTDRDLDAWPVMNTLARELPHLTPLSLHPDDLYRAGIMIQIMDAALARLPERTGTFFRGIDPIDLGTTRVRFLAAHQPGAIVQYEGYTSVMDGDPYPSAVIMEMRATARDVGAFSVAREPELVLPRHAILRIGAVAPTDNERWGRLLTMTEESGDQLVPARAMFADAAELARLTAVWERIQRRRRDGPAPTQAELDRYERMQVEAGGTIPARFKHLQYLNRQP